MLHPTRTHELFPDSLTESEPSIGIERSQLPQQAAPGQGVAAVSQSLLGGSGLTTLELRALGLGRVAREELLQPALQRPADDRTQCAESRVTEGGALFSREDALVDVQLEPEDHACGSRHTFS